MKVPRRKRGRDKPRGEARRNRKQNLPALNATAAWRIGRPKPTGTPIPIEERDSWVQLREPFDDERALGETIGWYNVDGKIYLGSPDNKKAGISL